jgi:hypothetical protein
MIKIGKIEIMLGMHEPSLIGAQKSVSLIPDL